MSDPTTTNDFALGANSILHDSIFTLGVNAALTAIFANAPFLNIPIVRSIVKWIVNYIAGLIYSPSAQFIDGLIMDAQISSEVSDEKKATNRLILANKSGDKDAIQKSIQDLIQAGSALVHYDGDAHK